MKAFIFPGQGSQRKGMGENLFTKYPEYINQANNILGYDVEELCLKDPNDQLNFTAYTQPAIFIFSVLNYLETLKTSETVDIVAGHSIGEYAALFVAKVFDFETGLRIVLKRAELMAQAQGGGLAAVLGLSLDDVQNRIVTSNIHGIEIANVNSPTQIVIGGKSEAIQDFVKFNENKPGRIIPLRVSGAFHTSHMKESQIEFSKFLSDISFQKPQIPVISNYTCKEHTHESLPDSLAKHLTNPVNWISCIETILQFGVESFTEIGSKFLTPMVKDICDLVAPREFSLINHNTLKRKVQIVEERVEDTDRNDFCLRFGFKKPLVVGGTGYGASGVSLVSSLCSQGILSFLDTETISLADIEAALKVLANDTALYSKYGVSLQYRPNNAEFEEKVITLCIDYGVRFLELRGYLEPTESIVRYRLNAGLDENNRPNNHIIIRTGELDTVSAFIDASVDKFIEDPSERSDNYRAIPLTDGICFELQAWRSTSSKDLQAFHAIRSRCDEYLTKQSASQKIYLGLSGLSLTQKPVELAMAQGADFLLISSPFLLTKESNLDDSLKKSILRSSEEQFKEVFDWFFPACQTKSLSYIQDECFLKQSDILQELYLKDRLTASAIREEKELIVRADDSLISETFLAACEGMSKLEIRAAVRTRIQEFSFPRIINCSEYFPELLKWLMAKGDSENICATNLVNLICPTTYKN